MQNSQKVMTPLARFGCCLDSLLHGCPSCVSFSIPFLLMTDFTSLSVDMLILLPYNSVMEFIQDSTMD